MRTLNLTKSIGNAASADVKLLQDRLTANGWGLTPDGIAGPKTLEAFYQYQAANGLTVDGICGPQSWEKLLTVRYQGDTAHQQRVQAAKTSAIDEMLAGINLASKGLAPNAPARRGVAAVRLAVTDWYDVAEVPDGANTGPRLRELVDGYNAYWKIGDTVSRPWCAISVSQWIRMSLGIGTVWSDTPMRKWYGGVAQFEAWAKGRGIFKAAGINPTPGEIFTMGRGGSGSDPAKTVKAGHTGLVMWDRGDGSVETIEGNTGNRVARRTRKKSTLRGFIPWWVAKKD